MATEGPIRPLSASISGRGRDSSTSVFMANWGPDGRPPQLTLPQDSEADLWGGAQTPPGKPGEGVSMVIPPHSLPREPGLTGSQLQLLRGEVMGGRGIAQRWGKGPPLIPPSQTLVRLQMADGPPSPADGPPSPISMTKAGRGLHTRPWSLLQLRGWVPPGPG